MCYIMECFTDERRNNMMSLPMLSKQSLCPIMTIHLTRAGVRPGQTWVMTTLVSPAHEGTCWPETLLTKVWSSYRIECWMLNTHQLHCFDCKIECRGLHCFDCKVECRRLKAMSKTMIFTGRLVAIRAATCVWWMRVRVELAATEILVTIYIYKLKRTWTEHDLKFELLQHKINIVVCNRDYISPQGMLQHVTWRGAGKNEVSTRL